MVSRILRGKSQGGVVLTEVGAAGSEAYEAALDVPAMATETTVAATHSIPVYNSSGGTHKQMTRANFLKDAIDVSGNWTGPVIPLTKGGAAADLSGATAGNLIYKDTSALTALANGAAGQVLAMNYNGTLPLWVTRQPDKDYTQHGTAADTTETLLKQSTDLKLSVNATGATMRAHAAGVIANQASAGAYVKLYWNNNGSKTLLGTITAMPENTPWTATVEATRASATVVKIAIHLAACGATQVHYAYYTALTITWANPQYLEVWGKNANASANNVTIEMFKVLVN